MMQLDGQVCVQSDAAGVERAAEGVEAARMRVLRTLDYVAKATAGSDAHWVVGGSCGLVLRGIDIGREPKDLDLYVDEAGVSQLHAGLAVYAVDMPQWSVTERYRSLLSHYAIDGLPVELVGGFVVEARGSRYRLEVSNWLIAHGKRIERNGSIIHLAPLSHELLFNLMREREDRAKAIVGAAILDGTAASLADELERLAKRNGIALTLLTERLAQLRRPAGGGDL